MFGRNRRTDIKSIDEMPALLRVSRVYMPAAPPLESGETLLFDFSARRDMAPFKWWRLLVPWGLYSMGRLTLTDRRLIYATRRRNWTTLFLMKTPSDLGRVEVVLSDITAIGRSPWWNPLLSSMMLPWFATADVALATGDHYRFQLLIKKPWRAALRSLAATYPQFLSAAG